MNIQLPSGALQGTVRIPASKSQAHRLLICAALGKSDVTLHCDGLSQDIRATMDCLRALGAQVDSKGDSLIRLVPGRSSDAALLPCGESGSTLRFLLSVAAALGADATFLMEGRLPQRPLAPLDAVLERHGVTLTRHGDTLTISGQLLPGEYTIPGNVSSQYISGLLMALPLLREDRKERTDGAAAAFRRRKRAGKGKLLLVRAAEGKIKNAAYRAFHKTDNGAYRCRYAPF